MLWALLAPYGLAYGWSAQIASYAVTVLATYIATRLLPVKSTIDAFVAGLTWAGVHLFLDLVYIVPTAGLLALGTPFVWIGYALVVLTPLVTVSTRRGLSSVSR